MLSTKCSLKIVFYNGYCIVVVYGLHALHCHLEAAQMGMLHETACHVAYHVLHKAGRGKGVLCDVFLVLALQDCVHRA